MMGALRRAGGRWRLLVHEFIGNRPDGTKYGVSHAVEPRPDHGEPSRWRRHHELPGNTEFDELVVGSWIHLEQMDDTCWWMNVGGVTVLVTVDRDGRPKRVQVFGPDDYDEPVPGCDYECTWTDP